MLSRLMTFQATRKVVAAVSMCTLLAFASGCSGTKSVDAGDVRQALENRDARALSAALEQFAPVDGSEWSLLLEACGALPEVPDAALERLGEGVANAPPPFVLAAAREAQRADDLDRALGWLESGAERHPEDRELVIERAKLLAQKGQSEAAAELLRSITSADPRVLNLLGYTELLAGRNDVAGEYLERAVEEARSAGRPYAPAHYHLGLLALSQGRDAEALAEFRRAAEINPRHLEAHYQWLSLAERSGAEDEAQRARAGFAAVNGERLEALGAFDEPLLTKPIAVDRSDATEARRVVEDDSFRRTFPAGSTLSFAMRLPVFPDAIDVRISVVGGSGEGQTLIDTQLSVPDSSNGPQWVPQTLDLPEGIPGAESTVLFEMKPACGLFGMGCKGGGEIARFSEPSVLSPAVGRSEDARPNILLFSLDTLRADRVGAYGYEKAQTPAIDALAESGVRFSDAQATSNWTLPSHYSLFSGLTPAAHGVMPNLAVVRGFMYPDRRMAVRGSSREKMLAEVLEENGYKTAAVTENGWVSAKFGFDQGFEYYRSDLRGSLPTTLEASLSELREYGSRGPWFLFVHTYTTHHPYHAPRELRGRFADKDHVGLAWPEARVPISDYNRFKSELFPPSDSDVATFSDLYDAQVAWVDTLVGRVVDWLDQEGLREQTLIVITSDHGEEIFERGQFDHGDTLYEEVTRVPLIFNGPLVPREVVTDTVSLIDVAPTILELAGLQGELGQGKSQFLRWLDALPEPGSDWQGGSLITSRPAFAFSIGFDGEPIAAVWNGRLKYIERGKGEALSVELYDLARDPGERNNLARRRATEVTRMQQLLAEHRASSAEIRELLGTGEEEMDEETLERLRSLGYAQ